MSEFDQPTSAPEPLAPRPSAAKRPVVKWWNKPLLLGYSLPWLLGGAAGVLGAAWYFFGPQPGPSLNTLAFGSAAEMQPARAAFQPPASPSFGMEAQSSSLATMQDDVARMVGGLRSYEEATRAAVERLNEANKAQAALLAKLQGQVAELQAANAVLSGRLDTLWQRPGVGTAAATAARGHVPPHRDQSSTRLPSVIAQMHLSAIQTGMAWVLWQDKTWAVQVGDTLGPVTITGIDAATRQVRTTGGILQ